METCQQRMKLNMSIVPVSAFMSDEATMNKAAGQSKMRTYCSQQEKVMRARGKDSER
jgi:hypothetical protein